MISPVVDSIFIFRAWQLGGVGVELGGDDDEGAGDVGVELGDNDDEGAGDDEGAHPS